VAAGGEPHATAERKGPSMDGADRVRLLGMSGRALSFGATGEAYERFRPGIR